MLKIEKRCNTVLLNPPTETARELIYQAVDLADSPETPAAHRHLRELNQNLLHEYIAAGVLSPEAQARAFRTIVNLEQHGDDNHD